MPDAILAPVQESARALARVGHRIVEIDVGAFDWTAARRAAFLLTEVEGARVHSALLDDALSAISPICAARWNSVEARAPSGSNAPRHRSGTRAAHYSDGFRSAMCCFLPTTPQAAFQFGAAVPASQADLTAPASIAGLPAVSLPAGTRWKGSLSAPSSSQGMAVTRCSSASPRAWGNL